MRAGGWWFGIRSMCRWYVVWDGVGELSWWYDLKKGGDDDERSDAIDVFFKCCGGSEREKLI